MSEANVEVIRSASEALENEGVDAMLPYVHPDFEVTTPPDLASEPDTYRGEEGIRRYFDSFYEAMEEVHLLPEDFIDAGERVIVPTRLVAKGRGSGIEVEQRLCLVWSFRDGQIVGCEPVATLEEAREKCGLQSQPTS